MKINDICLGVITKIKKTYFIVELDKGYKGSIYISNTSDYYVASLNSMFKVGGEYKFKIISIDEEKKWVKLDWKSIHPRFLKNPFKYKMEETENGFNNLLKNTMKEVNND